MIKLVGLIITYYVCFSANLTQIAYWEVYEGAAIRELEGSQSGAINAMHITQGGRHFVTGLLCSLLLVPYVLSGFYKNIHPTKHELHNLGGNCLVAHLPYSLRNKI